MHEDFVGGVEMGNSLEWGYPGTSKLVREWWGWETLLSGALLGLLNL